jgi:hypothetical protein
MGKLRYLGLIGGTVLGLVIVNSHHPNDFYTFFPVPFGIIGYGIGALFGSERTTSQPN